MPQARTYRATRAADVVVIAGVLLAGLYLLRDVLIPIVVATFLAFLLAPLVRGVQRFGLRRVLAVVAVLTGVLLVFGVISWFVTDQAMALGSDLPNYRHKLVVRARAAADSIRTALWPVSQTIGAINREIAQPTTAPAQTQPAEGAVVAPPSAVEAVPASAPAATGVESESSHDGQAELLRWLSIALPTVLHPTLTLGITAVLVFFFLVYHDDLRDRIIRTFGDTNLGVTTSMLTDFGVRFSRYVGSLVLVNTVVGVLIGGSLWALGVPNALLFGILAGLLRFIPFVGPWIAAGFPILLSLAVFDGWTMPVLLILLYLTVDLLVANALEPWLYGIRAGASPAALILAMVIWSWLWGAMGLLLATPITVGLVVLGKYVPQLQFLYILLGNEPVLEPHARFYQRLLAADASDAIEIAEKEAKVDSAEDAFSRVVIPGLALLDSDGRDDELEGPRETNAQYVVATLLERLQPEAAAPDAPQLQTEAAVAVLAVQGPFDVLAGGVVTRLFELRGGPAQLVSPHLLIAEVIESWKKVPPPAVCLVSVRRNAVWRAELLCRWIADAQPQTPLLVGLWAAGGEQGRIEARLSRFPSVRACPTLAALLRELDARVRLSSASAPTEPSAAAPALVS